MDSILIHLDLLPHNKDLVIKDLEDHNKDKVDLVDHNLDSELLNQDLVLHNLDSEPLNLDLEHLNLDSEHHNLDLVDHNQDIHKLDLVDHNQVISNHKEDLVLKGLEVNLRISEEVNLKDMEMEVKVDMVNQIMEVVTHIQD